MPSENVATSNSPDRRTRKRDARRELLLDLAADLVDQQGVDGLTMAALAEAADYATASLYTYFPSRSALLAALQQRALATLGRVTEMQLSQWNASLASGAATSDRVDALTRLWAFSHLFLAAPDRYPREFKLQQQLLVTPGAEDTADAATVVPAAMVVLDLPRRLLADATATGALDDRGEVTNAVGESLDGTLVRTFAWIVALNGALMVDGLTTGLPSTGVALGDEITGSLLRGWGADPEASETARGVADQLVRSAGTTAPTQNPGSAP